MLLVVLSSDALCSYSFFLCSWVNSSARLRLTPPIAAVAYCLRDVPERGVVSVGRFVESRERWNKVGLFVLLGFSVWFILCGTTTRSIWMDFARDL